MSSILDKLGLDPEDFQWQDLALCTGMPTELFYDKYESDMQSAKAVDEVCKRCPVVTQCLMSGQQGEHGVWGGIFWNGAGKPDKNKNKHKSDEDWAEIYERVKG